MADKLETRLVVTDDASKVIDRVADKLEDLERQGDAEISITAEDRATDEIRTISQRLAGLSDEDKTIVIRAQVADAEKDIARILRSLSRVEEMDDEEIEIRVNALGNARERLDQLQAELRQIDGETATVQVEARGLDDISDKLGAMPGQLGDVAGAAAGLGAAGGFGALAATLVTAANAQAELAISAKTTADLTGATVEEASKLQTLWGRTGADVNDLNDVLLQMNGVLAQSPEFAAQLGINLADGRNITQRFIEVTDKLAAGQLTAQQAAQLFGEEGVRQVGRLRTQFGALGDDLESIEPPIDDAAVADAIAYKNAVAQLTEALKLAGGRYAQQLVSAFGDLGTLAEQVADALPGGAGSEQVLGWVQEYGTGLGLISKALEVAVGDSEEFNTSVGPNFAASAAAATQGTNELGVGLSRMSIVARDARDDMTELGTEGVDALTDIEFAAESTKHGFERLRRQLDMQGAIQNFQESFLIAAGKVQDGVALTGDDILGLKNDILNVAEYARLNPVQVQALMDAIDRGEIEGVLALAQAELDKNPGEWRINLVKGQVAPGLFSIRQAERTVVVGGTSAAAPAGAAMVPTARGLLATPAPTAVPVGSTTVAVPIVVAAPQRLPTPSITINAAVVGNRFDVERTVAESLRRWERRNGRRRP